MKRKFLSVFFFVLLIISVTACKAKEVNTPVNQATSSVQKTSEATNTPKITQNNTIDTSNNVQPKQKQLFYGKWEIKKQIAFGPVSIYSNEDIKKMIGKKLNYSDVKAVIETNICETPYYKKLTISQTDFETSNKIKLSSLGITNNSIDQITVYISSSSKEIWDSIGCIFYVKDQNTLVLFDGGVYFELDRIIN